MPMTYGFETKCDRCGHMTGAGGRIGSTMEIWMEFNQYLELLRGLGWSTYGEYPEIRWYCSNCKERKDGRDGA